MYTAFYGLREKPFALSPDPRFLYLAASHREALAHLLYGIEQGEGFISVTGEVGTGKTTLCRTLLERLEGEIEVAFLFNPSRTALELLQTICAEFGLPAEGLGRRSLMAQLNGFLLEKKREGRRVLLIIDEAQTLSENTLEQVRLLSNLETSREKLIQILLLGQPELDRKLDEQGLRQLRQRISVRWQLAPLEANETKAYVRHRIAVASGEPKELFSDPALREVYRRTGGIPRLVNQLCDRALLAGYAARAATIGPRLIRAAAREIPDTNRPRNRPDLGRLDRPWIFFAGMFGLIAIGVFGGLQFGRSLSLDSPPVSTPGGDSAVASGLAGARPSVAAAPPLSKLVGSAVDELGAEGLLSADSARALASAPQPVTALSPGLLARMLESRAPGEVVVDSQAALMSGFGRRLDDIETPARSAEDLEASLNAKGLATTAFRGGSFELMAELEHPVALSLHPDGSARDEGLAASDRWVALLGLEGDRARLAGIYAGREVTVSQAELAEHWTRTGLIVWERFESIPDSMSVDDWGGSVVWLQKSLSELGYYTVEPNGVFDENTSEALIRFQRARGLGADGIAGPLTQIALFGQLTRYPVPRLSAPPAHRLPDSLMEQPSNRADQSAQLGGGRG